MLSRAAALLRRSRASPLTARAPGVLVAPLRTLSTKLIPSIDDAKAMPRNVSELSGEMLFVMANLGGGTSNDTVLREMLRREIMAVDGVEYVDTKDRLMEISAYTDSITTTTKLPYQIGIVTSVTAGWLSLPLVFHYGMASKFNDMFVTCDPPAPGEADTWLEVGSWTWNWMEPPLGALSFFLLCMQFAREQRLQIGAKPFTERVRHNQGSALVAAFPQYNEAIIRAYAETIALYSDAEDIEAEQKIIEANVAKL